jgi:hypothetical protein
MTSREFHWPRVGLVALAAAMTLTSAAVAVASNRPRVPVRDQFKGSASAATGKFSSDHATVTVYVKPGRTQGAGRLVTVILVGRRCKGAAGCMNLNGRLTGELTARPSPPDAGRKFAISVAGKVTPLGHVNATGTVYGTGFIRRGREGLQIKLGTPHGDITIGAQSAIVPGFTSP